MAVVSATAAAAMILSYASMKMEKAFSELVEPELRFLYWVYAYP